MGDRLDDICKTKKFVYDDRRENLIDFKLMILQADHLTEKDNSSDSLLSPEWVTAVTTK